jgi:DNA-binding LytR/AlgR family response regulator
MRRWWPLLVGLYAWTASTVGAALYLWRNRALAGMEADLPSILLWQGLMYGLWLPVGLMMPAIMRRWGLGRTGLVAAALLAPVAILLHAAGAAWLDTLWSPRVAELGLAAGTVERLPTDLLVYMVLVAAAWGLAASRRASALAAALDAARSASRAAVDEEETLLVSLGQRRLPVPVGAVEWLGAAGNYVVVNWDGREGLIRSTLSELEERLDAARFARVHRSTIANFAMVESASSLSDGSWRLTMHSGAELVASRSYRDRILARLGRR